MRGLSALRRGRGLVQRARRSRLRRRQPRFAGLKLISQFRAQPREPRPRQPYLPSGIDLSKIIDS